MRHNNSIVTTYYTWHIYASTGLNMLTHWGRVTHICVSRLTITGSDNGLSPGRHQAIIWTNAGKLLIGPLGTNFSENLIEILTLLFKKMHLQVSFAKQQPFCLGLNVLMQCLFNSLRPRELSHHQHDRKAKTDQLNNICNTDDLYFNNSLPGKPVRGESLILAIFWGRY